MKSHVGSVFTLGKGAMSSSSTKPKVNGRSAIKVELIGIGDKITKEIWTNMFIEYQGFKISLCVMFQEKTSTIKLIKN